MSTAEFAIFVDHVLIDPTFCGIFVCGPLQSFVVNVRTIVFNFIVDIYVMVN